MITPTIIIIDVPPKLTLAPNVPEKNMGITETTIKPQAPKNII